MYTMIKQGVNHVDFLEKPHYYVVDEPSHCQKVQIYFFNIIAR